MREGGFSAERQTHIRVTAAGRRSDRRAPPGGFGIGVAALAATMLALTVAGSAPASYPAPAQRLLVTTDATFGPRVVVMDDRGRTRSDLGIMPGLNGGIAVSREGTELAYVQAFREELELPPGLDLPPRIRRQLAHLPQTMLLFGSFLLETRPGLGFGSSAFISLRGRPIPALGRPAWAPGGRRIVFSQARFGEIHLYVRALDSPRARPRQLTSGLGRDLNPRWSPDGRTIVFERTHAGATDIYSVRPDGSDLRLLVGWSSQETAPDFAPDGGSLVFSSNLTGRFQLYVMPANGGTARRLTRDFGDDRRPVWSPTGRWIAYSSDRDGDNDDFVIDPRGERERKLTNNASEDLVQDWQPLRDARAPIVRALPSSGPRGRSAQLRFVVREASRYVTLYAELLFRRPDGSVGVSGSQEIVRTRPQKIRRLNVEPFVFIQDEGGELRARFRFCLAAVDAWGNVSPRSCAGYQFR